MRILVTGGAGFIGSHTVDALLKKGHSVRILDNLQQPVHLKGKPDYLPHEAEFIFGDVTNRTVLEYALDGMEAVYHFAAYQDYLPDFSTFFKMNAVSTALIYEVIVAKKLPVKKVIVASSQAVLGEGLYQCESHGKMLPDIRMESQLKAGRWEHECPKCGRVMKLLRTPETEINPQNQYALSKHSEESIAICLGKRYDIPSVAMRYSIVQGPRQSFYNTYSGAMRIFALHLFFNKPPLIFEDGQQNRDYINIQDVVAANLLVLEDERANGEIFNVGGGRSYTVSEFYETMQRVTGKRLAPKLASLYRFGDTRHIFSDTQKLQNLGWAPKVPIEQSIADYWTYLSLHTDVRNIFDYAEKKMVEMNVIRNAI